MNLVNGYIGAPVKRVEDLRFVRGCTNTWPTLARSAILHASILRSPVAHRRVRAIDPKPALAIRRLHAVITAAEVRAVPRRQRSARRGWCRGDHARPRGAAGHCRTVRSQRHETLLFEDAGSNLAMHSLRPRRTPTRHSVTPNIQPRTSRRAAPHRATAGAARMLAEMGHCGGAGDGNGGCKGALLQPSHRPTNDGPLAPRGRFGAAGNTGHMR
jgi:hypothetical protein